MKKLIKQLEHGRWVLIEKDKKNPLEEAWPLMEGLYERVEGGAWVNKKTGEFYKVKITDTLEYDLVGEAA